MRNMRLAAALALVFILVTTVFLGGCGQKLAVAPQQGGLQGLKKLKVGLVFDVGGRGDKSFNDAAYEGLEKAEKEFGDKIEIKYLEPSAGGENRERLLRLMAQDKYDLIFGVGFIFTDSIAKVAKEFPQIKFGLIDGFVPGLKAENNISCLLFREHEGSFLVGAAAAMQSKTGKIGFVGGMQSPLIEKFETGYIAGAKYINPNIGILSDYIGTASDAFKDPVKGKELTLKQIKDGADVIYHASGASGIGVLEAAASQQKFVIGVDSDQSLPAKEDQRSFVLTSMLKRVDVAVYETIRSLVTQKFQGGYQEFGVQENGVGYAENQYNKELIAANKAKLDELKEKIIMGEIKVPTSKEDLK
ncbi:MAG TPA: BMP family ABC transporter substrate-binding protein [Methylomusa anaerophila]|uniref:Membrane lipoprotein TmpC n=1 Tax=Methylomusa anaerophila TaxID=1930071 RepID=A0A348AIB0_9FIRM|nr:BMP family ABC transporter substrate-binding protein [Methylomusa anaerophila]BBB90808.1 membrane lipoprotein TmpC precursor [Methylomusa anaerophila]HML90535.1 BMP family ABC transporter substrate-binding protein [Methylomusa anaerophila]